VGPFAWRRIAKQQLGVQIHGADVIFQVVDDERRQALLLELQSHDIVPLAPDKLTVLQGSRSPSHQSWDRKRLFGRFLQ